LKVYGPPVKDNWSEETRKMGKEKCDIASIRLAALEGVEWNELKMERSDEGSGGYVVE
jgi:hypothetical protein